MISLVSLSSYCASTHGEFVVREGDAEVERELRSPFPGEEPEAWFTTVVQAQVTAVAGREGGAEQVRKLRRVGANYMNRRFVRIAPEVADAGEEAGLFSLGTLWSAFDAAKGAGQWLVGKGAVGKKK